MPEDLPPAFEEVVDRLARAFAGDFSRDEVEAVVRESSRTLGRTAEQGERLTVTEHLARSRLWERKRSR